ncbi:imelysin family protein [Primorskyibacter sp. 2E107]|uniref:imelysin family protein n=1 Tax=Primorskyibacter sp. 2E107 TaxID=3403458 RepID=UPI003AF4FCA4
MRYLALISVLIASPVLAGVDEVVDTHILPRFQTFADAGAALATAADADCTATAVRPAYQAAFDAWMGVSHLHFGPLEDNGRTLAIAFWPDTRGLVAKTVGNMVTEQDPAARDPEAFSDVSVAGRGFFALERLLFEPDLSDYATSGYRCAYVQALASDLARSGAALNAAWEAYATVLKTAGEPGNTDYLTAQEASQRLYTALLAGLEFTEETRLGRPLGTFDRPRPNRAEARRSGRSLQNVILSLDALRELARTLANQSIPVTEEAFETALSQARDLNDPDLSSVENPMGRLKVEVLAQSVGFVRDAVEGEIGERLGLTEGFNSLDGD